jgi:hypothetical protein
MGAGRLHAPLWTIMQASAPSAAAGAAAASGRPDLAVRLIRSGLVSYALAKGVKRIVRRGPTGGLVSGGCWDIRRAMRPGWLARSDLELAFGAVSGIRRDDESPSFATVYRGLAGSRSR